MTTKEKRAFNVGDAVWICRDNGLVFTGTVYKAGPISYHCTAPDQGRPRETFRKHNVFRTEVEARRRANHVLEWMIKALARDIAYNSQKLGALGAQL